MRYLEFRDAIHKELLQNPAGLTWAELKGRLDLPYNQPCPEWLRRMEEEVGLSRARGAGRAYERCFSCAKRLALSNSICPESGGTMDEVLVSMRE